MRFLMKIAILVFSFVLPATFALGADPGVVDTGTTAWMLISTALVLLMVPGLAMFYGGLVRTKNVLGTMMHSFVSISIIGVLWVVCGYSLTFGKIFWGDSWDGTTTTFFSEELTRPSPMACPNTC